MDSRFALVSMALVACAIPAPAMSEEAKPRVAEIDWSQADVIGVSQGLRDRVPDADSSYLPVLIPKGFFDYKSFQFIGQPLEYSASVRAKTASLSIVGTRIAIDTDTSEEASEIGVVVELDEKSARASSKLYGAAYTVAIECVSAADTRCTNERYVRDLLASVELLGGAKGVPQASPIFPTAPDVIGVSSDPLFKPEPAGSVRQWARGDWVTLPGVKNDFIYAPNIIFPIKEKPAYLNSQLFGYGGGLGPPSPSGWKDKKNYSHPWRDNFCETRSRRTPACPSGTGHQGVDIRPADGADKKHVARAAEGGRITKVGVYSVTLAGNSGNHYNYLHLEMAQLRVRLGQQVKAGQDIGLVSNDFGGTPTSVHLHFEIMQNANGRGWRHVPPYASLVAGYKAN